MANRTTKKKVNKKLRKFLGLWYIERIEDTILERQRNTCPKLIKPSAKPMPTGTGKSLFERTGN